MTEIERQNVENDIAVCEQLLRQTDYKALKHAEGALSDDEFADAGRQRQEWRDRINELQARLAAGAEGGGSDGD